MRRIVVVRNMNVPAAEQPLDLTQEYFRWLYTQVLGFIDVRSTASYQIVCDAMHQMDFDDSVSNDDNRSMDAKELRRQFALDCGYRMVESDVMEPPAKILEVLVALCYRGEHMSRANAQVWFNIILRNLGLLKFTDSESGPKDVFRIDRILRKMNNRRYSESGNNGGMFPLKLPNCDQRKTELWYQMAAYITENGMY